MAIDASIYQAIRPVQIENPLDQQAKAADLQTSRMRQVEGMQQLQGQQLQQHLAKASAFGQALDSLSTLKPEDRAQGYERIRGQLIQSGVITPDQAPPTYDDGFYNSTIARYRQTKPFLDSQLEKANTAKAYAEAKKFNAEAAGSKNLSPGQKAADEAFGKDMADYSYGGGQATVEKNLGKLSGGIDTLKSNPDLTGHLSMKIPLLGSDAAQDVLNPQMAQVRDDIRGAIQGTLRQVLGPQFTEKEGTAIFNRAFNPRLTADENARRATQEMSALQNMAADKERAQAYFRQNGTLQGFVPRKADLSGQGDENVAGQPKRGGYGNAYASEPPRVGEIRKGYAYLGGDPKDPKSWKKAR
ncbi:MAG TPA: hypothetical protein VL588_11280 [Bdellovibrionota bacterium]|jgi:hypothetical protein|nr:hypothetical protein [Bdellovibrionota bacterium]